MTSNKWLIIILALSVAGNFALVGFLAGQATGSRPTALMDPMFGMRPMLRELTDERRRALEPELDAHFRLVRPNMRQLHQVQNTLNEAITAEPFEAHDVAAALEGFRQEMCTSMAAGHESLVRLISAMAPEERASFVIRRPRPRGPRGPHPGRPPRGAER